MAKWVPFFSCLCLTSTYSLSLSLSLSLRGGIKSFDVNGGGVKILPPSEKEPQLGSSQEHTRRCDSMGHCRHLGSSTLNFLILSLPLSLSRGGGSKERGEEKLAGWADSAVLLFF